MEETGIKAKRAPSVADEVGAWQNGFWGQFAVRRVSSEPARSLLPASERQWRPATWRHFRHAVISHIQIEGAHTLSELAEDPPKILGLGLNREELRAVIDSARRRGEVEALTPPGQTGGREIEWVATQRGTLATSASLSWLSTLGTRSQGWASPAISLAAALGVFGFGASRVNAPSMHKLVLISIAVGLALWLLFWIRGVKSGSKPDRRVARDWVRWRQEWPGWYLRVCRRFPWKSALSGTVAVLAGSVIWTWSVAAGLPLMIVAFICFVRLLLWHDRWNLPEA